MEVIAEYATCHDLQKSFGRVNRLPNGASNISPHGHVAKSGALEPSDLCVWSPQDSLCQSSGTNSSHGWPFGGRDKGEGGGGRGGVTKFLPCTPQPISFSHRAVRQHYVKRQQDTFRSMEIVRANDAKRAAELMEARCTRISGDLGTPRL
jgi:hypothetical protein